MFMNLIMCMNAFVYILVWVCGSVCVYEVHYVYVRLCVYLRLCAYVRVSVYVYLSVSIPFCVYVRLFM